MQIKAKERKNRNSYTAQEMIFPMVGAASAPVRIGVRYV